MTYVEEAKLAIAKLGLQRALEARLIQAQHDLETRVAELEAMLAPQAGNPYTDILSDGGMDPRDRPEESKPIDWSQVADCVPVRVWDDDDLPPVVLFPAGTRPVNTVNDWDHASLITGIDIAWSGGECPLPGGVEYVATLRDGSKTTVVAHWDHYQPRRAGDIISFRVTGIHPDWTEEAGE